MAFPGVAKYQKREGKWPDKRKVCIRCASGGYAHEGDVSPSDKEINSVACESTLKGVGLDSLGSQPVGEVKGHRSQIPRA